MKCFEFKSFSSLKDGGCCDKEKKQPKFMFCVVRVNSERKGWPKVVSKILGIEGLRCCTMGGRDELLEVSGRVDPKVILKAIGKTKRKMQVLWFQSGDCSSFLYGPDRRQFLEEAPPPVSPLQSQPLHTASGISYPFRHGGVALGYGRGFPPSYYDDNITSCNVM